MRVATLWLLSEAAGIALAALTTISPCPAAPTAVAPPPITVTSQYQPVSTCVASSTSCARGGRRCKTEYAYSTYDYVSTVIPCPFGTSSVSTITSTQQSVLVSRSTSTKTDLKVTQVSFTSHGKPTVTPSTATSHTTLVREWSAPYNDLGPLAIPGYGGSGLCKACDGPSGAKIQVVEAVECKNSPKAPTVCSRWPETWIYVPAPTATSTVKAICASRTAAKSAGTYTFAFPQRAPPVTMRVPARTITYTAGGNRPTVITTTITETVTIVPARTWTAWVTRHCAQPTWIDFEVTVTTTIYYTVPPFTPPGPRPTWIPVPTGWNDWTITTTKSPATTSQGSPTSTSVHSFTSESSSGSTISTVTGPITTATQTSALPTYSTPLTTVSSGTVSSVSFSSSSGASSSLGPITQGTSTSSSSSSSAISSTPTGISSSLTSSGVSSGLSSSSSSLDPVTQTTTSAAGSSTFTAPTSVTTTSSSVSSITTGSSISTGDASTSYSTSSITTESSSSASEASTSSSTSAISSSSTTDASSTLTSQPLSTSTEDLSTTSSQITETSSGFTSGEASSSSSFTSLTSSTEESSTSSAESSSSTESPSTTSSLSSGSLASSTTSTSTESSSPTSGEFIVFVGGIPSSRLRRRQTPQGYVAFDSDDKMVVVQGEVNAATFVLDSGGLVISDGQYVGVDATGQLVRSTTIPVGPHTWRIVDGILEVGNNAAFCQQDDETITLIDSTVVCPQRVILSIRSIAPTSTTTTMATTGGETTTSETTTTETSMITSSESSLITTTTPTGSTSSATPESTASESVSSESSSTSPGFTTTTSSTTSDISSTTDETTSVATESTSTTTSSADVSSTSAGDTTTTTEETSTSEGTTTTPVDTSTAEETSTTTTATGEETSTTTTTGEDTSTSITITTAEESSTSTTAESPTSTSTEEISTSTSGEISTTTEDISTSTSTGEATTSTADETTTLTTEDLTSSTTTEDVTTSTTEQTTTSAAEETSTTTTEETTTTSEQTSTSVRPTTACTETASYQGSTYVLYYKGSGLASTLTALSRFSYSGTSLCSAIEQCSQQAYFESNGAHSSFNVFWGYNQHGGNGAWVCDVYLEPNSDPSVFSIVDPNEGDTFAFVYGPPEPTGTTTTSLGPTTTATPELTSTTVGPTTTTSALETCEPSPSAGGKTYNLFYSGSGYLSTRVPIRSETFPADEPLCSLIQQCATDTANMFPTIPNSFDVYRARTDAGIISVCAMYSNSFANPNAYNVPNDRVLVYYAYNDQGVTPTTTTTLELTSTTVEPTSTTSPLETCQPSPTVEGVSYDLYYARAGYWTTRTYTHVEFFDEDTHLCSAVEMCAASTYNYFSSTPSSFDVVQYENGDHLEIYCFIYDTPNTDVSVFNEEDRTVHANYGYNYQPSTTTTSESTSTTTVDLTTTTTTQGLPTCQPSPTVEGVSYDLYYAGSGYWPTRHREIIIPLGTDIPICSAIEQCATATFNDFAGKASSFDVVQTLNNDNQIEVYCFPYPSSNTDVSVYNSFFAGVVGCYGYNHPVSSSTTTSIEAASTADEPTTTTTAAAPVLPTCEPSPVAGNTVYDLYYSGTGHRSNRDFMDSNTFPESMGLCSVIQSCAVSAEDQDPNAPRSFDVARQQLPGGIIGLVCFIYDTYNTDPSVYDVPDADYLAYYAYNPRPRRNEES